MKTNQMNIWLLVVLVVVIGLGLSIYLYAGSNLLNVNLSPNQTGSLSVSSIPSSAFVYLDGSYKGVTSLTIFNLSIGNHLVQLTKAGYKPYTTTKYIYAGSNSLNVTLTVASNQTNQTGSLRVNSIPSSASLYIDNSYKGLTPYTASGLSIGNHNVKLTRLGYNNYSTTKYIYAGSNSLNVTLTVASNQTG